MPIPVIVACIYALVTGEMEFGQAFLSGAAVSAIILVINLLIGLSHSKKTPMRLWLSTREKNTQVAVTKTEHSFTKRSSAPQTVTKRSLRKRAIFRDPPMNTFASAIGSVTIRSLRILMKIR